MLHVYLEFGFYKQKHDLGSKIFYQNNKTKV